MAVDRRAFVAGGLAFGLAARAQAQMQLDITKGQVRVIPLAVSPFFGDPRIGDIVAADLESSGLFRAIERAAFIERIASPDATPRFADWRVIKAEALVTGSVRDMGGDLQASYRLWDPFAQKQLKGEQFVAGAKDWRRLGHIIADAIYQRLTGEAGYFDTRIVFIDESGTKQKRVKRLAMMDQDGANVRYLTRGESLVLTPRFSPTRQQITYTSYEGGQPRVYLLDLDSGERRLVDAFPGMSFAPRFKPGGSKVILSIQQGADANLYEVDVSSRRRVQLTAGTSLDTAPSYSPDGRWIVFESDRGGSQQLYVMGETGGDARRIAFGEGSYSTPVWSPRGDLIAFTKRAGGQFLIGVMKPDGSGERILATGFHNEGPTWAPNGRVVLFFRESAGASGGPKLYSVDLTGYNERALATPNFASDPAWSPLLS